jgi:hypothetical protein
MHEVWDGHDQTTFPKAIVNVWSRKGDRRSGLHSPQVRASARFRDRRGTKTLATGFFYTVVKLNLTSNSVSFVEVADFDSAPEPTIDTIITVRPDGSTKRILPPSDPFIYHHKWLFVKDDYDGFDVEQSRARSRAHMALPDIDRRRIGRKNYWNTEVVPRLPPE